MVQPRLVRGLSLYSRAHLREEDPLAVAPSLSIPVYFFTGRHDHVDPFELTQEYFDRLEAPYKEHVWFDDSAHFPFLEEPATFAAHLRRVRAIVVR